MADHRNPFATWLDSVMTQRKISNTKLAAAPGIDVTAPAVIKWRLGSSIPRDDAVINAIADFFEADRAYVRTLAGRGSLGMAVEELTPDITELAYQLQVQLEAIEDPEAREMARENLVTQIRAWQETLETFNQYIKRGRGEGT